MVGMLDLTWCLVTYGTLWGIWHLVGYGAFVKYGTLWSFVPCTLWFLVVVS